MSNMSINPSVTNEINELEDYIKKKSSNFKTNSLVSGVDGENLSSIRAAKEKKAAEIMVQKRTVDRVPSKYDGDVKVEISEAGKLKAENTKESVSSLGEANWNASCMENIDSLQNSVLYKANNSAKEVKNYRDYEDALENESAGFKKAYSTQTIGKYIDSGINKDEIDLACVEKMNALYEKFREEINEASEDEKNDRLRSLDDAYLLVFKKNIVNPLKSQYDGHASFYENGALMRKDSQMEASYNGLKEAKNLYDALLNENNWHNSTYMKDVIGKLTDAIASYAKSK